jgi:type I restriction enzyme S subunit
MSDVVTRNFDIWTSAQLNKSNAARGSNEKQEAYGIKKLRELILDLAARGKLVLQDPKDETASELLKRAAVERARMVNEGRIRRDKDFPPASDNQIPFDLPPGWVWARVVDIGHDWGQKTPEADFTYIDVSAIDNDLGVISTPNVLSASDAPSRARKVVRSGTVIYSTVRPYLKNVCVIEEEYSPEPIASTAFAVLHPFQGMPGRFFVHFFRSPVFVKYVESVQSGIAYPAINDKQFYGALVPVPPLAEQHRIVAKVDELMAMCGQLEQQRTRSIEAHRALVETLLATLTRAGSPQELIEAWMRVANNFDTLFITEHSIDRLKQTILQLAVMGKLVQRDISDEPARELLGRIQAEKEQLVAAGRIKQESPAAEISEDERPYALPSGWAYARLTDLASVLNGRAYSKDELLDSGTPVLRVGNLFTSSDWYYSNLELEEDKYCDSGDLLFAWSASFGPFIWPGPKVIYHYHIWKLKLHSEENLNKHFLHKFLLERTEEMKASGHGVSMTHMTKQAMEKTVVPVPPRAEQARIVSKVDELFALCDALKALLADAQTTQTLVADAIVEQAVA